MLVNVKNGEVYIDDELNVSPKYTFEEFKKTSYFNGQDGILIIRLGKKHIDNREYYVSLTFKNNKLYSVTLKIPELTYDEAFNPKTKLIYDEILIEYGLKTENKYDWGMISSICDPKSYISFIAIYYPQNKKR